MQKILEKYFSARVIGAFAIMQEREAAHSFFGERHLLPQENMHERKE